MHQADIDQGHAEGLTTEEKAELVKLRRENGWCKWRNQRDSGIPSGSGLPSSSRFS